MITVSHLLSLQQAQVGHPELLASAQIPQPSVFPAVQNGLDPGSGAAPPQLDNKTPCQLPPQAQALSQVPSQIPVLQPSDSQRASSASASSCLSQQKQLAGAAAQGATEASKEARTHDSLVHFIVFA